jgi:NifB/MoaA-like Fe-S oxidoreductase
MEDLFRLGPGVLSLSVVPVGLTKYNVSRPVRPLRPEEASAAIRQVDHVRHRAREARGEGWVYAADELYLGAGMELPPPEYYDGWDLTENGVGSVASFLEAFSRASSRYADGPHGRPDLRGSRLRILTGLSMSPIMEEIAPRLRELTGAEVLVQGVANDFYGETVTVAGLLAGKDLLEAVFGPEPGDVILLPGEALNADDLFVDSLSLESFRAAVAPARVIPALDLAEALEAL